MILSLRILPDCFTVSQTYAIIVLPNGGPDLESYNFATSSKTGWRQAASLFWQVAKALAQAEELVEFEVCSHLSCIENREFLPLHL